MINTTNNVTVCVNDPTISKNHTRVSLSDIIVTDIVLDILLNKKYDTISGLDGMKTTRGFCTEALDRLMGDKSELTITNHNYYLSLVKNLEFALRASNHTVDTDRLAVSFATANGDLQSFTMIKVLINNGKYDEVHYLIPLIPDNISAHINTVLYIDGDGTPKYITTPLVEGFEINKIDGDVLIQSFLDKKTLGFMAMNLLKHDSVLLTTKEKYDSKYTAMLKQTPTTSIGLTFDINTESNVMVASILKNTFGSHTIDFAKINDNEDMKLVLKDERTYLDKLMPADLFPIEIKVLQGDNISLGGIDFDTEVIENRDKYNPYAEADTSTAGGRALEKTKRIPRQFYDQMKKIMATIRTFLVNYRKVKDDELKEKVINDEFVPILDNSMKWLMGGATGLGLYFVIGVSPLISLLGSVTVTVIKKIDDKQKREKALALIKQEITVLDEKINDARNSDDRQQKYALMRIRMELDKKLSGITSTRKFV